MIASVPPDSTIAYIIMQFCHFCGMQSFVSGPLFISIYLFYIRHTNLPCRKCARPRRRRRQLLASGATGATPRGQRARPRRRRRPRPPARPRRRLRPRPASGTAGGGHGHVQGGNASVLVAGAGHSRCLRRPQTPAPAASVAVVRCRRRPSARCRRRPRGWRPPRPRLRRLQRRNSTAGNMPKHIRKCAMMRHGE